MFNWTEAINLGILDWKLMMVLLYVIVRTALFFKIKKLIQL